MAIGESPHIKRNALREQADFETHYIDGYATAAMAKGLRGNDAYFNCPLISHIKDNLWTGGCKHVTLPEEIKYVISLYPWEVFRIGEGVTLHEFEAYDGADVPEQLEEIVDLAENCVNEAPTLIHCQAGLNRSGLVAASVLVRQGMTPADAIALLRDKRTPLVLCNETFENHVLSLANS